MKTEVVFQETQKQNQKWTWFLVLMILGLVIFAFIQQVLFHKPFGTHPVPDWAFLFLFLLPVLFILFLMRTELRTTINEKGISFSYRPFFKKEKVIQWSEIKNCYIRIYNPVKEYGGWGIRPALKRKQGKAYNVSGNKGIQVELVGGELILIGTGKPGEAKEKIKRIQSIK
jgi:uncharacterized membrane protein YhdT